MDLRAHHITITCAVGVVAGGLLFLRFLMMSMEPIPIVIIIQPCCIQCLLNPPILLIFAEEGLWHRTFVTSCALSTGGSLSGPHSDTLLVSIVIEPVVEHGVEVIEQRQKVLDQDSSVDGERPCGVDVVV